ncbi:hypothetical protein JGI3_01595 [Candidatus Kryptobacter tengchongensis]|uniref:DUF5320 family protein n=1 Tax=Kryptobacter tengchongensis TaxID=1643429 RepID=UPI000707BD39|nr:DUF5320 family protein [Candidatus Kryptobacter tengchongensis]CUS83672.1 hypothetical protein JGI20_00842 [Candidatus Kryptobacter tengchongensis]CUU07900.1 hypothetical protein JGI3_01595 [Candidatus Kryptobacter tengchongensis]
MWWGRGKGFGRRFGGFWFGFGFPPFETFWTGFRPYITREEYIEMLEDYKKQLEEELEEVNREIDRLKREGEK